MKLFGNYNILDKHIMKVLMLTWEYPPLNVGGISEHVYHLSNEIGLLGHEVHVITNMAENTPSDENIKDVFIHRVNAINIETDDFIKWIMHLNFSIIEKAIKLIEENGKFDIIHAHDWLCTFAAYVLKNAYKIPLISTIHATENGRNGGIWTQMQRYISNAEWKICYETWKVIVCSNYMKYQINDLFKVPMDKIYVVPNGVPIVENSEKYDKNKFRKNFADENQKIVYYVGRHVHEKGIHILIESASSLLFENPDIKFVISGVGPKSEELKNMTRNMGIESNFYFTGFIDSETKRRLYEVADVAAFPSLYEPFGIVALEAMEAGCPVVVTQTGGFNEIISHGINGMKAYVNSAESLAWNIKEVIENKDLAIKLRKNALNDVFEKYNWKHAAVMTVELYYNIQYEYSKADWN